MKRGVFVKRMRGGGREGGMGRRVFVVLISFLCLMVGLWMGVEMEYVDRSFFTSPSSSSLKESGGGREGGRGRKEEGREGREGWRLMVPTPVGMFEGEIESKVRWEEREGGQRAASLVVP